MSESSPPPIPNPTPAAAAPGPPAPPAPPADPAPPVARILVAEDAPEALLLLKRLLEKLGHTVTAVEDGAAALQALKDSLAPAGTPFDLVISDILMPNLDGFGLLSSMREENALRDIPVIVVSMLDDIESVVRCIELGARDYLFKPVNRVMLRARVNAIIERLRYRQQERLSLVQLKAEQAKTRRLLSAILPESLVDRLKDGPELIAESFPNATVLFATIHNFAALTADRPARELVELLSRVFSRFDELAVRHGVTPVKTIGETYVAAAGVPAGQADHAQRCCNLALNMLAESGPANLDKGSSIAPVFRIGIASGHVVGGVLGTAKVAFDLWGETVHSAAQMALLGLPNCIQVSGDTAQPLQNDFLLETRGLFYIEGLGELETLLLRGSKTSSSAPETIRFS